MGKFLDFDKFMSEKKKETIAVKVYGVEYTVASEIPASVPVLMARAENEMSGQEQLRLVMQAADTMFGKKAVDEICAKGMSAQDLADLVQRLFTKINTAEEPEDLTEVIDDESGKSVKGTKQAKK